MQTTPSTVAICLLIALVCAACSTDAGPIIPTAEVTPPTASHIAPPTATTAPPATRTRPAPTETDTPPTRPTPILTIPGEWRAPVVSVPDWDSKADGDLKWIGPYRLSFEGQDGHVHLVSADTGSEVAVLTSTPKPNPYPLVEHVSAAQEYHILCRRGGLQMIHTADQRLIAEDALFIEDCALIVWASDGMAAAIPTVDGEVYLWLTDGSAPQKIGQSVFIWNSYPAWSPDNCQILVLDNLDGVSDESLASFSIAYRDGRPLFAPNTPIEFGLRWEGGSLAWVTNTLIRNRISGGTDSYDDYYDARTGRFIIRNTITEMAGRKASISPDERFLVLEAARRDTTWKDRRYPFMDSENFETPPAINPEMTRLGLMVVNLDTLRRSLIIQERLPHEQVDYYSDSLKYLGWNRDSSKFFFIHFPEGFPDYDLPFGLLALYPQTGYIEPVLLDVAYGLPSPDGEHVFLLTAATIGETAAGVVNAAVYRLDGTPVTALQPLGGLLVYDTLNSVESYSSESTRLLPSEWNPDGNRLVYADAGGNVWLMDTAGNTTSLASNFPLETWNGKVSFSWSPDGQYLLIESDGYYRKHTWIAALSSITP